MKSIQLLILIALTTTTVSAQQLTTSSFYDMYGVLHNPAAVATSKHGSVGANYRTLWSAMPGSPKTGIVYGNGYLKKAKLGMGGYLFSDKTANIANNGLSASLNYQIEMKGSSTLSFGISGIVQQTQYDWAKLQSSLGTNDPVIMGDRNRIQGDAGLGVAFTTPKFQIGASVNQLVQSKLNLYEGTGSPTDEANLSRHFYGHALYKWNVDDVTTITPNILFIYLPNAPLEVQGGARVEHNNMFWYGLSWRVDQAWMISAGLRIKQKFQIGYSFDIYTSPLGQFDNGSNGHEIMLKYDFIK